MQASPFLWPHGPFAVLLATLVTLSAHGVTVAGTAFTPSSDAEVVERLPVRAARDPALRAAESMRRQITARPDDAALRIDVARRYFDLAMAQGDPRYVGYASGVLTPLSADPPNDARYWLVRGQLEQYQHQFDAALASFDKAARIDPASPDPRGWRAAVLMVQARYAQAQAECEQMQSTAHPLWANGCLAYARAARGELASAYAQLESTAKSSRGAPPELRLWAQTRLAEMALRLGQPEAARRHFQAALDTGVTDQFLLGAHADFLIAQGQAAQALRLLEGWERSDILLLRLALAARATQDQRADTWARELRERFDAAVKRGDRLHEWEAARFELDFESQPTRALPLARSNYERQKEPRDALMLMRAALAAGQPQAAEPALAWLRASRYEDPAISQVARQLEAGARR